MKTSLNFRDMTIVLADANAFYRKLAHSILRNFGANRILEFQDVRPVLRVLSNSKVDLIICDVDLPPQGGLKFTEQLRRNPASPAQDLPVLLLTGDTSVSTILKARDAGATMVLAKPFSPVGLSERLAWTAFRPRNLARADFVAPDGKIEVQADPIAGHEAGHDAGMFDGADAALSQSDIDSLLNANRAIEPAD